MQHFLHKAINALAPYLFVGPAVIFVFVFLYAPVVFSGFLSVSDWNFISPEMNFVGFTNYLHIFNDPQFKTAVSNTLLYCIVLIPAQIILPLGLARLLLRVRRPLVVNPS